ncbi:fluoride efflux transporter CrcB [Flavobacterium sp.]|jgi:CrcB protein|uniref:fluoride efflux transporter CrcB n=1 Tax=Flavobacterium sp. TaxID=239 RepID=UPI0025C5827C|nr:fluoride efflux transporter CrcB [Flavobacterium sp.]
MSKNIILVLLGGGIGSVIRYLLSYFFNKYQTTFFPWPTFIANSLGCFLIGLFFAYTLKNNAQSETLKLLLITGFCGGFTTFSTFSLENLQLIQNQNYTLAISYTISSLLIGTIAVFLGFKFFN